MVKTSNTGYVRFTLFHLATSLGIATGQTRIAEDGEIEAEFFLFYTNHTERTIWARRKDIY